MPVRIHIDRRRLEAFCQRHHIRRLAFFGSVLRDDFGPESDVDVLYEFEQGHEPGWDIAQIEEELSAIIGRRVDLVPYKHLNARIRDQVLRQAEVFRGASTEAHQARPCAAECEVQLQSPERGDRRDTGIPCRG